MKGSITKRADGVYLLRVSIGYATSKSGKRTRKYKGVTFHGPRKDAEKQLRVLVSQYESGGVVLNDRTPLSEYLEIWMELTKTSAAKGTKRVYESHIKNHINPALGFYPLSRITPMEIQKFLVDLSKKRGRDVLNACHTILNQALHRAVKWRRIPYNPVSDAEKPRQRQARKKTVKAFTKEELTIFLEGCKAEQDGIIYRVGLFSGARPGEYLGLQWPAVDWSAGGIRVEQAMIKDRGSPAEFSLPKTDAGLRFVNLPEYIMAELRVHRTNVLKARMARGDKWSDHDLVFPNMKSGKFRSEGWINQRVKQICEKLGLPVMNAYTLRHSFATMHLVSGAQPKVVQSLMGHATISETMDTYTHYQPDLGVTAAHNLGRLFE